MRKALVRLEQLQAEVAKAQKDAAEWEARALGHAKAARFAEDANTPLIARVAFLEKQLSEVRALVTSVRYHVEKRCSTGKPTAVTKEECRDWTLRLLGDMDAALNAAVTGTPLPAPAGDAKGK